ncbi:hypothetical protein M2318_001813 [Metapseudomonas resinovorans]
MLSPALRSLPEQPYIYAEWKKARVHIDYHVEVDGQYYSVPYQLVKLHLEVRLTARTDDCFHANQRVASHLRSRHASSAAPSVPSGTRMPTVSGVCCSTTVEHSGTEPASAF